MHHDSGMLHVYLPTCSSSFRETHGIVIVPGGSYRAGPYGWSKVAEGADVASYLAHSACVTAIVLNYRLPRLGAYARPVRDMQDAMTKVRSDQMWSELLGPGFGAAARPTTFGVLGFSAGGHLAALAATSRNASHRPDFAVLMYPLISLEKFTHLNSKTELLGRDPTPDLVQQFSPELLVSRTTAPTLLIHAVDDHVVPPANSQLYLEACRQHGPFCTYVTLSQGGHPFVNKPKVWSAATTALLTWLTWLDVFVHSYRLHSTTLGAVRNDRRNLTSYFTELRMRNVDLMLFSLRRIDGVLKVSETNAPRLRSDGSRRAEPSRARAIRPPPWIVETWGDPAWDEKGHQEDWRDMPQNVTILARRHHA